MTVCTYHDLQAFKLGVEWATEQRFSTFLIKNGRLWVSRCQVKEKWDGWAPAGTECMEKYKHRTKRSQQKAKKKHEKTSFQIKFDEILNRYNPRFIKNYVKFDKKIFSLKKMCTLISFFSQMRIKNVLFFLVLGVGFPLLCLATLALPAAYSVGLSRDSKTACLTRPCKNNGRVKQTKKCF